MQQKLFKKILLALPISLAFTLVGLGSFLIYSGLNPHKDTKSIDAQQVEPTIEIVSLEQEEPLKLKKKVKLQGVCGLDGSAIQYENFEANPCKVIDTETQDVLATVKGGGRCAEVLDQLCLSEYSRIILLGQENDQQFVYSTGGEGGGTWGYIYALDLDTQAIKLIDQYSYDYEGKAYIDLENDREYIKVYDEKTDCSADWSKCEVDIFFKDSAECSGSNNPYRFIPECFENWDDLSEQSKSSQLIKLNESKEDVLSEYNIEVRYMTMFYGLLYQIRFEAEECQFPNTYNEECQIVLERIESSECNDPFNPIAYTQECLLGWEKLEEDDKAHLAKFPGRYTEVYGPRYQSDYETEHN